MSVTKVSDVKNLVGEAKAELKGALPAIRQLAASDDWGEREVAATVLVEVSKKNPNSVLAEMISWADDKDPNIRRCASESLREIARRDLSAVVPILTKLNGDDNLYVKKSVANVLRNAGNYFPDAVLNVCQDWGRVENRHTAWIIKDGLRKLRLKYPERVEAIVSVSLKQNS
jgi:3-methyladenine DNA glycosylase AlkC